MSQTQQTKQQPYNKRRTGEQRKRPPRKPRPEPVWIPVLRLLYGCCLVCCV